MNNLIQIQGKVIEVKPAKTGYCVAIWEQETSKKWRVFSQWGLKEGDYSLVFRQDGKYFFITSYQALTTQEINGEINWQAIHQPYEAREKQAERQLIQKLQVKIKQLTTEAQQWKNAYYNQKSMLKEAQQNAHQQTVQTKIKAIQSKPGKKTKQDLDYLKLLTKLSQECEQNWAWLGAG